MTDITQRRKWSKQIRRLNLYEAHALTKVDQYNVPTKNVKKEARRLIRVPQKINPRQHLKGVRYQIQADLGNHGRANTRLNHIRVGPQASPFTIAHELGHLLPDKGATRLEEEARASRHALRILKAAGYKDSALRRMRAQGMAAYENYRTFSEPDAVYARLMRNPIAHLFPPNLYSPHQRKRARALYDLVTGRRQPVHNTRIALRDNALIRRHPDHARKRWAAGKGRMLALAIGAGLLTGYGLSQFKRKRL